MIIYLAGAYRRRDKFRQYANALTLAGFSVASRWLDETYAIGTDCKDLPDEENRLLAKTDVHDILRAEAMLFFAEDSNNQPPRGGRHVEFGIALVSGKQLFVVGEKENVFHFLPGVKHYSTFEEFLSHEHATPAE